MKRMHLLAIALLVVVNLILLFHAPAAATTGKMVDGLKGSVNGVFTCHCPDDAKSCYCDVNTNQ